MIFPEIQEITYPQVEEVTDTLTPKFDFKDFVLINKKIPLIKGQERIKQWIKKILLTQSDQFEIYKKMDSKYGMDFYKWYSGAKDRDYIESELTREVSEKMLMNEEITEIYDISFEFDLRKVIMYYSVNTIYGEVTESVQTNA